MRRPHMANILPGETRLADSRSSSWRSISSRQSVSADRSAIMVRVLREHRAPEIGVQLLLRMEKNRFWNGRFPGLRLITDSLPIRTWPATGNYVDVSARATLPRVSLTFWRAVTHGGFTPFD